MRQLTLIGPVFQWAHALAAALAATRVVVRVRMRVGLRCVRLMKLLQRDAEARPRADLAAVWQVHCEGEPGSDTAIGRANRVCLLELRARHEK